MYVNLVKEGAPMGYLNLGGGLAIDYSGRRTADENSMNYTMREYCADIVEAVQKVMDEAGVTHPDIVTESGRAVVAYYSVLVFDILDVNRMDTDDPLPKLPRGCSDTLKSMLEVVENLPKTSAQETYHDIIFYRDERLRNPARRFLLRELLHVPKPAGRLGHQPVLPRHADPPPQ